MVNDDPGKDLWMNIFFVCLHVIMQFQLFYIYCAMVNNILLLFNCIILYI